MAAVIALWLALLAPQTGTPATPQTTQIPAAQSAQPPSPDLPVKYSPQQATPLSGPRPNPDDSGKYHIGDGVTAPKVIYQVDPEFTKDAKKQKVSGIALMSLIVDTEGNTMDVHILRSIADSLDKKHHDQKHLAAAQTLDQAAVDAVRKYKFEPARLQGKPVPVELNVEVSFQSY